MNQSTFIAGLTVWLAIASTALGLIARWVLANGPTIAAILEAIKGLKSTADTHTAQIAANTQAVHQTALATPAPIQPSVAQPPPMPGALEKPLASPVNI